MSFTTASCPEPFDRKMRPINAAAIIIGLSQLPTLLGLKLAQSDHFLLDIWSTLAHLDTLHGMSVGFGLAALVRYGLVALGVVLGLVLAISPYLLLGAGIVDQFRPTDSDKEVVGKLGIGANP